jgi:hypothetical protein
MFDSGGWFYDTASQNCEAEATCAYPCSNCYVAGGSKDLTKKFSNKELQAMCGEKGFDASCGGVHCKYNTTTQRCECKLTCCDGGDEDGSGCLGCTDVPFEGDFAPCPKRESDSKAIIVTASPCRDKSLNMTEYADSTNGASLAGPPWAAVSSGAGAFNPGGGSAVGGCCEAYECDMTITARAFPWHTSAPKYYAAIDKMVTWKENYSVPADSSGRHNAMVQKDDVVDALAWTWVLMIDSLDIIESVVCRFYGGEVAAKLVQKVRLFDVQLNVTTGEGGNAMSVGADYSAVQLKVSPTGVAKRTALDVVLNAVSDGRSVPSAKVECGLIWLAGGMVHETLHTMLGSAGEHLKEPCFARTENCDPLTAMECRLMEALALAYSAEACQAPCSEDGSATGVFGACPPCHAWDGNAEVHIMRQYYFPITVAAGYRA